jgi:hypothetical protein
MDARHRSSCVCFVLPARYFAATLTKRAQHYERFRLLCLCFERAHPKGDLVSLLPAVPALVTCPV